MTLQAPNAKMLFNELAIPAFDEATVLFFQRNLMLTRRQSSLSEIATIDIRLQNNFDHLRFFPEAARAISAERFYLEDDADAFVSSYLAFMFDDNEWIRDVLDAYLDNAKNVGAIAQALACLPKDISQRWIEPFLASRDLRHKCLAVDVCRLTQYYPQSIITKLIAREDCRSDLRLHESLLKLIGQMKDHTLAAYLLDGCSNDSAAVKAAAHWARLLIGDMRGKSEAQILSFESDQLFNFLYPVLIRTLTNQEVTEYFSHVLKKHDIAIDLAISAIGAYGDPQSIPWLVSHMTQAHTAAFAGVAFHQMTGVDINEHAFIVDEDLVESVDQDVDQDSGPSSEQAPEEYFFNHDNSLVIPDAEKIKSYWRTHHGQFTNGHRYFLGKPIVPSNIATHEYFQKIGQSPINFVYSAADIELAILNKTTPYKTFVTPQYPLHTNKNRK